jgi:isopropylmalate/homocitrate/citramalate synthase
MSMTGVVCICVGSMTLAGCATGTSAAKPAGNASTTSTASASPSNPKVEYTMADAKTEARIPDGYQLIRRNGIEFFCHSEPVTGSRTQKKKICQTKEQMEADLNSSNNTVDYAAGR